MGCQQTDYYQLPSTARLQYPGFKAGEYFCLSGAAFERYNYVEQDHNGLLPVITKSLTLLVL
jgi:hypothetical protein